MSDEETSVREWAISYLEFTIKDIAQTKKHLIDISYYGVLLQSAAFFLVKTFHGEKIASCAFDYFVFILLVTLTSLLLIAIKRQFETLDEFRGKIDYFYKHFWPDPIKKIPPRSGRPNIQPDKLKSDIIQRTFFLLVPVIGLVFVSWYLWEKSDACFVY